MGEIPLTWTPAPNDVTISRQLWTFGLMFVETR